MRKAIDKAAEEAKEIARVTFERAAAKKNEFAALAGKAALAEQKARNVSFETMVAFNEAEMVFNRAASEYTKHF